MPREKDKKMDRLLMAAGHVQEEFDVFVIVGVPLQVDGPPMLLTQGPFDICQELLSVAYRQLEGG